MCVFVSENVNVHMEVCNFIVRVNRGGYSLSYMKF